jgi:hypothetical protein
MLARLERDELDLCACEIAIGGNERKILDGGVDDKGRGIGVGEQRFVDRSTWRALSFQPDAARQIPLGIDIDEKNPPPSKRKRRRQINGSGCLSDAALLVGHGNDSRSA